MIYGTFVLAIKDNRSNQANNDDGEGYPTSETMPQHDNNGINSNQTLVGAIVHSTKSNNGSLQHLM